MTRFERDLRGDFGTYWKKDAMRGIMNMRKKFLNNEIIIEDDGAVKWVSSNHYLPEDCVQMLEYALYGHKDPEISAEATRVKREAQEDEAIKAYRRAMRGHVLTDEERYEMESAFGKGSQVVDVLTGDVYFL